MDSGGTVPCLFTPAVACFASGIRSISEMKVKWRNIAESSFTGGLSGANENIVTINSSATG